MPDAAGNRLNQAHRRHFLLSGLLTCGCCGGGYTITGKDRYGCANRRSKSTCDNSQTIVRQRIEQRVLGALKSSMLTPELAEEFIRTFAEEMAIHQREAAGHRTQLEHTLAGVERRLQGVLRAIEDGAWNESLRTRLTDLETSKTDLTARLANLATPARIVLHPNAASLYAAKVADLETALTAPSVQAEAGDALRSLIERIVLTPDPIAEDGLAAELHGDLAMILELAAAGGAPDKIRRKGGRGDDKAHSGTSVLGSQLSVVAGTRNRRSHHSIVAI